MSRLNHDWTIFNKKELKGNLQIARSQQEEALLTFQYTLLSAGQEVSDILYGYHASLSKNDYRVKQIASLKNAVDYTRDLLIAGEANYTEVLSAQQDLLSAQLNQVDDKLEKLTYGQFYRANRQILVNRDAIKEVSQYFARKLSVSLVIPFKQKIIVSKEKGTDFLNWLSW